MSKAGTTSSMLKICNSVPPHFTRYICRFHLQKSSAFYPFQQPHIRRSACLHFTVGQVRTCPL